MNRVSPLPIPQAAWFLDLVTASSPLPSLARLGIGVETVPAGTVFPRRRLPDLVFILTLEGECLTLTPEGRWAQAPGTLLILNRHVPFQERVQPGAAWRSIYWMMQGAAVEAHPLAQRVVFMDPAPADQAVALRAGPDLAAQPVPGNRLRLQSRALDLLAWAGDQTLPPASIVERVGRLVDAQPDVVWSLDRLARACRLPAHTLVRRFRSLTGESPGAWVRRRRLERTIPALLQGWSVKEVAMRHGFADPFIYSKAFKSVFGVAPSGYALFAEASRRRD